MVYSFFETWVNSLSTFLLGGKVVVASGSSAGTWPVTYPPPAIYPDPTPIKSQNVKIK